MFDLVGSERKITDRIHIKSCLQCQNHYSAVPVKGDKKGGIMVVLTSPSIDGSGKSVWSLVGEKGFLRALDDYGYNSKDMVVTGVYVCTSQPSNKKYECCLANLQATIAKYQPSIIFAIGSVATGAVLRLYNPHHFERDTVEKLYVGQCIPLTKPALLGAVTDLACDCWLVPLMSAYEIHVKTGKHKEQYNVAQELMYEYAVWGLERYKEGRPKPLEVPKLDILYSTQEIVSALDSAMGSKYVAFDYETNRLDPYYDDARILTASFAYGDEKGVERTVVFPFTSTVTKAKWIEFLRSPVKKIGANIKFENTWSKTNLLTDINNWFWDICIVGRILDCERGKAGLKFITFSTFGVIGYDDSVSPYMEDDENGVNKLNKMDKEKLMTYNAYDSAFTYLVCREQHKLLGYEF